MADGIFHEAGSFVEAHPMGAAAIGVGVVLVIWYMSSGSTAAATTVVQPNTAATAADLAAAQISANAGVATANIAAQTSVTQAQIAAGVVNNTTAAQEAAAIANSNSLSAIAASNANASLGISANSVAGSEFTSLAAVLNNYGQVMNTTQTQGTAAADVALANSGAVSQLNGPQSASFLQSLLGGSSWTDGSVVSNAFSQLNSWGQSNTGTNTSTSGSTITAGGDPSGVWGGSSSTSQTGSSYGNTTVSASNNQTVGNSNSVYTPGQGALVGATSTSTAALSETGFLTAFNGLAQQVGNGTSFHSQ